MNKIKFYRKQKGLTLKSLANHVGISQGYLCHLEKGTRENPSCKVMKLIAKTLDVELSDLF